MFPSSLLTLVIFASFTYSGSLLSIQQSSNKFDKYQIILISNQDTSKEMRASVIDQKKQKCLAFFTLGVILVIASLIVTLSNQPNSISRTTNNSLRGSADLAVEESSDSESSSTNTEQKQQQNEEISDTHVKLEDEDVMIYNNPEIWQVCVGLTGEECIIVIDNESNGAYNVEIVEYGMFTTSDFVPSRIRIYVDESGLVTQIPFPG